jgi:hypothetical protein
MNDGRAEMDDGECRNNAKRIVVEDQGIIIGFQLAIFS